jgi:hypothetical protein
MKVTATFVRAPRLILPAVLGTWTIAAVLLAAGGWLLADTLQLRSDLPLLERRLSILQRQYEAAPKRPLPSEPQLSDLRERVRGLNKLSASRGWTTSQLLGWLEVHLPPDIQLLALHHKANEGVVLLSAEAASAAALTGFLSKLEREPAFGEVLLSKQSAHAAEGSGSGGGTALQFEIKLKLKS